MTPLGQLEGIFKECLTVYPELGNRNIQLLVEFTADRLDGAIGRKGSQEYVILFVPRILAGKWSVLKPIIHHELCHYINLENPDREFFQRADEKSVQLWKMLRQAGALDCSHGA